ncbi:insulin-like 3 [Hyperolius riggenbachi]|uniref:insulin-like 3 n=1 Tax=Hyperolius riggenbachi TaxID=752182 RepID=UPI0035A3D3AB
MSPCLNFSVLLVAFIISGWTEGAEVSDVGIKLCGRNLMRTLVTSCGGSRWKRYSPEPGQERASPYRDLLDWLNRASSLEIPDHLNSVYADSHRAANPPYPVLLKNDPTMDQLQGAQYDSLMGEDEQGLSLRMKRSAGQADDCCHRGCTMTELMKYC